MKTLIVYCYYETEKTKENLDFFCKNGLIDSEDYYYIFIVNNIQCSVTFPTYSNIQVYKRSENQNDLLTYKWYIETVDTTFLSNYSYFYFINSSCIGPFMPPVCHMNWITTFNIFLQDYAILGPIIEIPPDNLGFRALSIDSDKNIPFIHTYMFGVNTFGFSIVAEVLRNIESESKEYAVLNTERKITSSIILKGGKVKSLLARFTTINLNNSDTWDYTYWNEACKPTCYEVPKNYFGIDVNPFEIIFVKNIRNQNETRTADNSGISTELYSQIKCYRNWLHKY